MEKYIGNVKGKHFGLVKRGGRVAIGQSFFTFRYFLIQVLPEKQRMEVN